MTSLTTEILGLSVAYALLGVLLLTACLFTRFPWPLKAVAIILTSIFYVVSFYAARGLLGWSSVDPLPPRFKLLHARIVEPHSLAGDPGAIHLWIEAIDDDNRPSGGREPTACPTTPNLQSEPRPQSKPAPTVSRRADALRISALAKAVRARLQRGKSRRVRSPRPAAVIPQRGTAGSGNSARREPQHCVLTVATAAHAAERCPAVILACDVAFGSFASNFYRGVFLTEKGRLWPTGCASATGSWSTCCARSACRPNRLKPTPRGSSFTSRRRRRKRSRTSSSRAGERVIPGRGGK